MKKLVFVLFILGIWPLSGFSDPWSVTEKSPVIPEKQPKQKNVRSFWDNRFELGYYFYQKVISPADGARCGMYPTCADYGYQAMRKHGSMIGIWMTADRFMRDHGYNEGSYSLIEKFGRRRFFDPINENDFWFSK